MKKTLLYLPAFLLFLAITSCSNDDNKDNTSDNKGYCNVTIDGETLRHEYEEGETFSLGIQSCTEDAELRIQNVGQFEKSNYFLDIYLVHKGTKQQFLGYNVNNTNAKSQLDILDGCYSNFDLIIDYENSATNNSLNFNSLSNNFSKIESVSVYKENTEEIIYAVKGKFEVTYKKADNTLIPVKGDYRTFIYVLK